MFYFYNSEDETINPMVSGYQDDLDPDDITEEVGLTVEEIEQQQLASQELDNRLPQSKILNNTDNHSTTDKKKQTLDQKNFLNKNDLNALDHLYKQSPQDTTISSVSAPSCSSYSADASEIGSEAGSVTKHHQQENEKKPKLKLKEKVTKDKTKKKSKKKRNSKLIDNDEGDYDGIVDEDKRLEDFLGPADNNLKTRPSAEYELF